MSVFGFSQPLHPIFFLISSSKAQYCAGQSLYRYPVCYIFQMVLWSLRSTKLNYILDEAGGRKLQFYLKHRTSLLCYVILELLHNLLKYLVGELTQLASC